MRPVPYVTLEIVKAVYIQDTPFYMIDNVYIILFDAAFAIHIYRHQEYKWYCEHAKEFAIVNPFSTSFLRTLYPSHQINFDLELNLNVFECSDSIPVKPYSFNSS